MPFDQSLFEASVRNKDATRSATASADVTRSAAAANLANAQAGVVAPDSAARNRLLASEAGRASAETGQIAPNALAQRSLWQTEGLRNTATAGLESAQGRLT